MCCSEPLTSPPCLSRGTSLASVAALLALLTAFCLFARGAEVKLEPNARWQLEFPDLPATLATMTTGKMQPARLTARLPANYSPESRFPLFVFLNGGNGGHGDTLPIDHKTVGSNDFICVNLPLFRRRLDTNIVSMDDFDTISRAYRTMLQRLLETVPNTTPERSALGGFSNGAHTTAVLLTGQDQFILDHFRAFFLIEGGFSLLSSNALQKPAMKRCRFLLLRGDSSDNENHDVRDHLAQGLQNAAQEHRLDFTSVVMHGYGHELPPKYQALLGQWTRGEKVTNMLKK